MSVGAIELEIIRHRLEAINADAGDTLVRVSGSQIASEASDFNTAIMTADGTVVSCSKFILVQSTSLNLVVAEILKSYGENPGIRPGDQFLTNDPYLGALHQPDVTLVAPVFSGGRLVAWSGSTVHEPDVGGPVAGGVNYAARSIFEEPIPIPPIKIVEGGVVRRDLERDYLMRSRTPHMNALDLLGQIAANRATERQLLALCGEYGADGFTAAMDTLLDATEAAFRRRLAGLPDGAWRENAYIQHERRQGDAYLPNQVYVVRLRMAKRGDRLVLDFGESDAQAPGAVNATFATLANFTMAAVLVHLCQDLPWMPGAIWRTLEIRSRKGTIVDAAWPAGVAMSTGTTAQAIRNCVSSCIARLVDGSERHHGWAMASSQSSGAGGLSLSGAYGDGTAFATLFLDELCGGGGATLLADGTDTSGTATSPGATPSNIETNEAYYPVLYTMRRELADSGGPGTMRGGVGTMHAYRPHNTDWPIDLLSMAQGLQHPATMGILGGEPGASSGFLVTADGPAVGAATGWDDLGHDIDVALPTAGTRVPAGSYLVTSSQGGGGYGDPLERDPRSVLADVVAGLVSRPGARRDYGVVIAGGADRAEVDEAATGALRMEMRRARIGGREPARRGRGARGERISSHFSVERAAGGRRVVCSACGHDLCGAEDNIHRHLAMRETSSGARFPLADRYPGSERFRVRHFFCPGCALQVDVHVALAGEPVREVVRAPTENPAGTI